MWASGLCSHWPAFFFVFVLIFYRSSSALHRRSSTAALLGHLLCRGLPIVRFFVSGSSRIRTQVLVITMRMCYRCATLTPKELRVGFAVEIAWNIINSILMSTAYGIVTWFFILEYVCTYVCCIEYSVMFTLLNSS